MSERYRAFISYSHEDRKWADWLFRRIEAYRVPAHLVGQTRGGRVVPQSLRPLFKDREELATSSDLSMEVSTALQASGAIIVICSPRARESRWVNEEIRRYREVGDPARIFPLIVEGDGISAFPPALLEGAEPLAANVAPDQDGRSNAVLKINAALLNVPFDELKQRDLAARYRRLRYVTAASVAGMLLLVGLAGWAVLAQQEADLRRDQADGLIEFMIDDLRKRLEPIGRLDVLDEVGRQAETYFSTIDPARQGVSGLARRGKVAQHLGELRLLQGDPAGSRPNFEEALARQQSAFELSGSPQIRFDLAQATYWLGYSYWEAGDLDSALPYFQDYALHATALAEAAPDDLDWRLEVPYAAVNLGTLRFEREQYVQAVAEFTSAIEHLEALRVIAPSDVRVEGSIGTASAWLAGSYWELGNIERAAAGFERQVESARTQTLSEPGNFSYKELLALALQRHGLALLVLGQHRGAHTALAEALDHTRDLVVREDDNFFWRYAHAKSLWYLSLYFIDAGERVQAEMHLQGARASFPGVDDGVRAKWITESAELANDHARFYLSEGNVQAAAEELQRAQTLLGTGSAENSWQAAARAETLLLQSCVRDGFDEDMRSQLRSAREELDRFEQVGRDDFVMVKTWAQSESTLSACPARTF